MPRCPSPASLALAALVLCALPALAAAQAVGEWGTATVQEGKLWLDVTAAPLDAVLHAIAERAGFKLELLGDLSIPITERWVPVPLGEGLLRLVRGNSASLTYVKRTDGSEAIERMLVVAAAPRPTQLAQRNQQLAMIRRLSRSPGAEGRVTLSALLSNDGDPYVRGQAATALGRLGGPPAIAALTAALADPAPEVRIHVVRALAQSSGQPAGDMLAERLGVDPDAGVRREITGALARFGPTPSARAALEAAQDDADQAVRRAATATLGRWTAVAR
jgi:HEAT repeat protein